MVGVAEPAGELLLGRRDGERAAGVLRGVGGLRAAVEVVSDELLAALHSVLLGDAVRGGVGGDEVEGGEDQGCGFRELELAVGLAGGDAHGLAKGLHLPLGGGHVARDGLVDIKTLMGSGRFRLICNDKAVETPRFKELVVHAVEEGVCPAMAVSRVTQVGSQDPEYSNLVLR